VSRHAVQTPAPSPEVRAELMRPDELDAAVRARPVAFVPLGSLEFHSAHLPIGLDALTAHGVCVGAAHRGGGVVLPALHQGTGGGHTAYPWTVMMPTGDELKAVLATTLNRLQEFGFRVAVVFTGHFSHEQLALVDDVARSWNDENVGLRVLAAGVNRCPTAPVPPDHAGVFETSLLYALRPELVDIGRLPDRTAHPSHDPAGNVTGPQRHDPAHPLWGVFGPDPRDFDTTAAGPLLQTLVDWLDTSAAEALRR
jgi:creatinine amidohydrolase